MSAAEELVAAIREGHRSSLDAGLAAPGAFVAPALDLVHEPPHPADGRRPGAEMADLWSREGSLLRGA
ncbi:MAG: hypothetical protein ACYDD7_23110, partial [Acidimicrobiales bacterium]